MIYIYTEKMTEGIMDLLDGLEAKRLKNFDGMDFWWRGKRVTVNEGDVVICWGSRVQDIDGVRVLNSGLSASQRDIFYTLNSYGVPSAPTINYKADGYFPVVGSVGKSFLHPPVSSDKPDFYIFKYSFMQEYRVHSFNSRSIKFGKKVPRAGFKIASLEDGFRLGIDAHPRIRSFEGGWMVDYENCQSVPELRALAHQAVKVLDLTFGVVDIGVTAGGEKMVLKISTAPILDKDILPAYVNNIKKWITNTPKETKEPEPEIAEPRDPFAQDPRNVYMPVNRVRPIAQRDGAARMKNRPVMNLRELERQFLSMERPREPIVPPPPRAERPAIRFMDEIPPLENEEPIPPEFFFNPNPF